MAVCDPEGYVGASALLEIGFAQALGKKIVFVEKPLFICPPPQAAGNSSAQISFL